MRLTIHPVVAALGALVFAMLGLLYAAGWPPSALALATFAIFAVLSILWGPEPPPPTNEQGRQG